MAVLKILWKLGVLVAILSVIAVVIIRLKQSCKLAKLKGSDNRPVLAFFHPAADAMGGGEKVLYQALQALQSTQKYSLIVYSGSTMPKKEIFQLAK